MESSSSDVLEDREDSFSTTGYYVERVVTWLASIPANSSVPHCEIDDIELLQLFADFLYDIFFLALISLKV
jgi:hypothetical protein